METEISLTLLLDKFRSELDASKLMEMFNDTCRKSSKSFSRAYLRRWFLNFAIDRQRSELVRLLLSDLFNDLIADPRCKCVDFPVIPMPTENLTRAERFLRACSSMNLTSTFTSDLTYGGLSYDVWSPFEYACVMDQPEIMKTLISSYGSHHDKQRKMHFSRKMLLHLACLHGAFNCVDYLLATKDGRANKDYYNNVPIHGKLGKATPIMLGALHGPRMLGKLLDAGASLTVRTDGGRTLLHVLMLLAHENFRAIRLSLPEMVRLVLEAGAHVNDLDVNGFTALSILMTQVRYITNFDGDLSPKVHRAVIEIVKLLVEAGSDVNGSENRRPVEIITNYYTFYDLSTGSRSAHDFTRITLFPLAVEIVDLLLMYDANSTRNGKEFVCYKNILACASQLMEFHDMTVDIPGSADMCNSTMDIFGDLFRRVVLSTTGANTTNILPDKFTDDDIFVDNFVSVAGLSYPPGRSKRLIRQVLRALSTNQLSKLKTMLSARQLLMTDDIPDQIRVSTNKALDFACAVETLPTLECLSQRAVTRAISYKNLLCDSSLEIPPHLRKYIQLND